MLEIDVNGALQVKEKFENCILIFLIPPTMKELENRLILRNTESPETIEDRLYRAREEVKLIDKYDYLIINDEIDKAVEKINMVVMAENLRPSRNISTVKKLNGSEK